LGPSMRLSISGMCWVAVNLTDWVEAFKVGILVAVAIL
jgi:hypothetical protein